VGALVGDLVNLAVGFLVDLMVGFLLREASATPTASAPTSRQSTAARRVRIVVPATTYRIAESLGTSASSQAAAPPIPVLAFLGLPI